MGKYNRPVKFGLKIPNRLGKMSEKLGEGGWGPVSVPVLTCSFLRSIPFLLNPVLRWNNYIINIIFALYC